MDVVDKEGNTVDFMLSEKCDRKSVLKFFNKAIGFLYGFWHLLIEVRRVKYLNNMVEQDHRSIKRVTKVITGFKFFQTAETTIAGSELHHILKKNQLDSNTN